MLVGILVLGSLSSYASAVEDLPLILFEEVTVTIKNPMKLEVHETGGIYSVFPSNESGNTFCQFFYKSKPETTSLKAGTIIRFSQMKGLGSSPEARNWQTGMKVDVNSNDEFIYGDCSDYSKAGVRLKTLLSSFTREGVEISFEYK